MRTQYGINWRRPDGRSHSAADPRDAHHTRNLGVVMEGACDREALRIARYIAGRFGIAGPDSPDNPRWWAYRDVTGQLGGAEDPGDLGTRIGGEAGTYVAWLCRYENRVNRRYELRPNQRSWNPPRTDTPPARTASELGAIP
ncbi:hypothetical protein GCM10023100_40650 [Actinocorallia cavernae]|uniref:Uncharacterized protein n=2 Tax=Actinomycetes TaxID=1760 RepID=A0ABP8STD0_9ACTN